MSQIINWHGTEVDLETVTGFREAWTRAERPSQWAANIAREFSKIMAQLPPGRRGHLAVELTVFDETEEVPTWAEAGVR